MPWLRAEVAACRAAAERIVAQFESAGAVSVSLLPGDGADRDGGSSVLEPGVGETPLWDAVRVRALLPLDADLSALDGLDAAVGFVADEDWSSTWRSNLQTLCFGRLVVAPTDAAVSRGPRDAVLRIDPGLAFGTGGHPSTALCLGWLAEQELAGRSVLDMGCGSGILAIAALRLGAASAFAVDHDPQARDATAANARANGVEPGIGADLRAAPGRFDIALANIVAGTLRELAPLLSSCADAVVLSGILESQADDMRAAFPTLRFDAPRHCGEWILMSGRRDG